MTPSPDPEPDPDPDPEPTTYSVALTLSDDTSILGITTWLQSGDSWGDGIVGSTTVRNGTHTFSNVPAGDYYIYVAPTPGTVMSDYTYFTVWNNAGVSMNVVTNGSANAWRSASKVTVSGNSTLSITISND